MALVLCPDETGRIKPRGEAEALAFFDVAGPALACDTETTGLGWLDTPRLVQFGDHRGGIAIDVQDEDGRALVRRLVLAYRGVLIFHNAPFDIHMLEKCGVEPEYVWPRAEDTYVMSHVVDPAMLHGLKALGVMFLDEEDDEASDRLSKDLKLFMDGMAYVYDEETGEQLFNKNGQPKKKKVRANKFTWADCPRIPLAKYGIKDTVLAFEVFEFLRERMDQDSLDVYTRELEVAQAVYGVQDHGMVLDKEYALNLKAKWDEFIEGELAFFGPLLAPYNPWNVAKLAKDPDFPEDQWKPGNPNSKPQWGQYLIDQGWEPTQFSPKTKKPKLDKKVKEVLADEFPIVAQLMEYERIVKWRSAYVVNSLEQCDSTGRVHARYNTLGAVTGRMSCSQPPLQQLPKGGGGEIRSLYVASEGNVMASVDYAAIEMRLAGALSGEQSIIDAYAAGSDLYTLTAEQLGITRPESKIVVLASLYGWGGSSAKTALDKAEGKRLVGEFWNSYPSLSRFNTSQMHKARSGRIYSMWGRLLVPHAPFAALNAVIQGTAAEVLKDGILRLAEEGLLRYVVALVHDEVVLDVPEDEADAIVKQVVDVLRDDRFAIPIVAEGEVYGRSWGDGYTE